MELKADIDIDKRNTILKSAYRTKKTKFLTLIANDPLHKKIILI